MKNTKEFYDLLEMFEKFAKESSVVLRGNFEREPKDMWPRHVYCNGSVNDFFQAYMNGYSYGKLFQRLEDL